MVEFDFSTELHRPIRTKASCNSLNETPIPKANMERISEHRPEFAGSYKKTLHLFLRVVRTTGDKDSPHMLTISER